MSMAPKATPPTVEPETDPDLTFDTYLSVDDVSAVWVNGLMVWLQTRGDMLTARPLATWRQLLTQYQALT